MRDTDECLGVQALTTALPGVLILEPKVFGDERGYFMETYSAQRFAELSGCDAAMVQDNHSRSVRGVLRGLHYQLPPKAQGKLVRAVAGEIFDVAVDIRRSSPTFGRWTGALLSADNKRQLWVPPGFAHGFYTVSATAEVVYKCTEYYAPQHERGLRWDDPVIAITWPLVNGHAPALSAKDAAAACLADAETFA